MNTKAELTAFQESALAAMYALETGAHTAIGKPMLLIPHKALTLILGVTIHSYHRGVLRELVASGWLTETRLNRTIYYTLTDAARSTCGEHFAYAARCCHASYVNSIKVTGLFPVE